MKSHSRVVALALVTVAQFVTTSARAQQPDSLTQVKSNGAIGAAPAAAAVPDTSVHKKGGMFGKLKSIAHNKTVQNITKAAVCQAIPGGQYMLGAAEAAKNKTSIASGAANAGSCIPGMGGGVGGMGGLGGGKGALVGAAMGAAGSMAGGATPGQGAAGMAGALSGRMKIPGGGKGVTGALTANATAQSLAAMQSAMAQMNAGTPGAAGAAAGAAGAAPAAADAGTEASGEQLKLSGDVNDEIKKGKLTIKKIDWVHGQATISAPSTEGFMTLMQSAGQAMKASGGTYRVDVYTDKKYTDQEISTLGAQRQIALMALLQAGGASEGMVTAGKLGKDKEQRVEIVKVK